MIATQAEFESMRNEIAEEIADYLTDVVEAKDSPPLRDAVRALRNQLNATLKRIPMHGYLPDEKRVVGRPAYMRHQL